MATKSVRFCDYCESQESGDRPVLPTFFVPDGKEACYQCAEKELRRMYGMADEPVVQHRTITIADQQPEEEKSPIGSAAFRAQKMAVEEQFETQVYVIKPTKTVAIQDKLMWGPADKQRQVEVLAEVECERGSYFVRLC